MIVLEGASALSPFRRDRLQARLQALAPALRIIDTRHAYWIEPEPGAAPDRDVLRRILQAGDEFAVAEPGSTSRFVVPRLGTLSPWASKATELLRGAGLPVKRVERGLRIDLAGWPADPARQAALAIENDLLQREMVEQERLEREMQLAREIQRAFLPQITPELPGWDLKMRWLPAREVGGDFYDFFELPGRRLGLVIADVADKGMPAALFMTLVRTLIRTHGRDSEFAARIGGDIKGYISLVLYILAVGLSFVNSWISLAVYFAVAMIWFIPDRRFER